MTNPFGLFDFLEDELYGGGGGGGDGGGDGGGGGGRRDAPPIDDGSTNNTNNTTTTTSTTSTTTTTSGTNRCGDNGGFGNCPSGFSCKASNSSTNGQYDISYSCERDEEPPTSPEPSQSATVVKQGCESDSDCGVGYFCDSNNITGYQQGGMGGDSMGMPIYGCSPIGPPPPTTPPLEDCPTGFIECSGTTGVYHSGQRNNQGQCTTTSVPNDAGCIGDPEDCPTGFIECNGSSGIYWSGVRDINGNCTTRSVANDFGCVERNCPDGFIECDGTAGIYYKGGPPNSQGVCETSTVPNDPQCAPPSCTNDFIRCEGPNAIYYTGQRNSSGECATVAAINDPLCAGPPICNTRTVSIPCNQLIPNATGTATKLEFNTNSPTGCVVPDTANTAPEFTNWDTSQCAIEDPCPPDGTFVECSGQDAIYYTGIKLNGTCQTRTEIRGCAPPPPTSPPPSIPPQCPTAGTFIECSGTTAIVYTGEYDNNGCTARELPSDYRCTPITPPPTPPPSETPTPSDTPEPGFSVTPTPAPSDTPVYPVTPSSTPEPSLTAAPSRTPGPTIEPPPVSPFVTPTPSITPPVSRTPAPSQTPITWRDCITGTVNIGRAPSGYREVNYPTGGTCWEPISEVGFSPSLSDALLFIHERGGPLPTSKKITATNPSYGKAYRVSLATDEHITVTPSSFIVPPRGSIDFIVAITYDLVNKLGDGSSVLRMDVTIAET